MADADRVTEEERYFQYRDLLEIWVMWWNGLGREHYRGNVLPPLTRTGDALACIGCAGLNTLPDGERCAACGRLGRIGGQGYFRDDIESAIEQRNELVCLRAQVAKQEAVIEAADKLVDAAESWIEHDDEMPATHERRVELEKLCCLDCERVRTAAGAYRARAATLRPEPTATEKG